MEENKILPQGLEVPNKTNRTRWVKAISLAILSVLSFALTWYLMGIEMSQKLNLLFWIWPTLSASFGIIFLAFLALIDINKYLFGLVDLLILTSYILFLPKVPVVYAGGALFFVFVGLFERYIREDEHSRADFHINRILRSSINFMVYGLLIVLGLNIYNQIQISFQKNPDAIYQTLGNYAADGLQFVPQGIGNFNPDQSFNDFIVGQVQAQDPQFGQAPISVQDELIESFKQQLESKFGLKISGNPLLGEVVAGAVAQKIKSISMNYSQFFPAIFALLVVILLRTVAFLFVWLTSILAWILFKILLMTKFFRIEKVQVPVDKLQI